MNLDFLTWGQHISCRPSLGAGHPLFAKPLGHDGLTTETYLNLSPEKAIKECQRKW